MEFKHHLTLSNADLLKPKKKNKDIWLLIHLGRNNNLYISTYTNILKLQYFTLFNTYFTFNNFPEFKNKIIFSFYFTYKPVTGKSKYNK